MDKTTAKAILGIQERIRTDPTYFLDEFIPEDGWGKQNEIIRSVFNNSITSVRSCHSAGKSWIAAKCALAFLLAHTNSYVITTATTSRQVEGILWQEIKRTYNNAKRPIGGQLYKSPRLDLDDGWFALGFTANDPESFQGFHPPSGKILVIVDEAAGIKEDIWLAIDSILSSQGSSLLMIGNPTTVAGRFHQSHHLDDVKRIHISCFDTPNFTENGIATIADLERVDLDKVEVIAPHLITPHWAKDKIKRWGKQSPMFQARVLGNFPSSEANTIIPLDLVETAATPERFDSLSEGTPYVGVDPARYGDDKTVITRRMGDIVAPQIVSTKEGTGETAGRVKNLPGKPSQGVFTDVDGVGGGVNDALRDDKFVNVVDIHNNASPVADDTEVNFANLVSQLWYHLMLRFYEGSIYIPEDQELMSELASRRYFITRHGWKVEDKDEFKKRIKRSPDKSDSLVYAFASDIIKPNNIKPSVGKTFSERYNDSMKRFERNQ